MGTNRICRMETVAPQNPRTRILHQYGNREIILGASPNHQARICRKSQKSLVTNPILSSSFASRGQVDLIDMRTVPDGEFKWILNYQDHFTKWVVLKGLKEKNAKEVAINLVTIFYTLGAPNILQSDNGKEFDNKLLLESLNALWPSTKIIHGKPRKPQSQGSVENANNRVQNILQCILEREGHTHWAKELDKVAYMKNTSLHEVLNNSPYKVLYGRDPPKGFRDFDIPSSLHAKINNVEDLEVILPDFEIESVINDEEGTPLAGDIITPLKSPNCSQLNYMALNNQSGSYSSGGKGESNDYDISMNFDLSSLGATAGHVNEGKSCSMQWCAPLLGNGVTLTVTVTEKVTVTGYSQVTVTEKVTAVTSKSNKVTE